MTQSHLLRRKRNPLLLDSRAPNWLITPLPHDAVTVNNPMFRVDLRGLPTVDELRRKTRHRMGMIVGGFVLIWLLIAMLILFSNERTAEYWFRFAGRTIFYLFLASLADKFLFDFIGIAGGLNLIRSDVTEGRWDLLNLTALPTSYIVASKQAVAEINGWNALIIVMGVRLAVVVLIILHLIVLPILMSMTGHVFLRDNVINFDDLFINTSTVAFILGIFLTLLSAAYVYVVEPRWRLRTLAAAGVSYSAQKRDISLSMLSGMSAFLQIWMAQVFMAVGAFVMLFISQIIALLGTLGVIFGGVLYIVAVGIFIHATYQGMARNWMNKSWRTLYKRRGVF